MQENRNQKQSETTIAKQLFNAQKPLQSPEETILRLIKAKLPTLRMLDVGVGCGRTTQFFAPLVQKYVGVDYAQNMIESCTKNFQECFPNATFAVQDATDLSTYASNSFDFVLFSYNGIDYVNETKRLQILQEIRRVLVPGGLFCFSSHNLYGLWKLLQFHPHRNPRKLWRNLRRFILMRLHNPSYTSVLKKDMTVIHETYHPLKITNIYIKPTAQIRQLQKYGFSSIRLFGLDGHELQKQEYEAVRDSWIYYLCRTA